MVMLLGITRDIFEIVYIKYARMNNKYIYIYYNIYLIQRKETSKSGNSPNSVGLVVNVYTYIYICIFVMYNVLDDGKPAYICSPKSSMLSSAYISMKQTRNIVCTVW